MSKGKIWGFLNLGFLPTNAEPLGLVSEGSSSALRPDAAENLSQSKLQCSPEPIDSESSAAQVCACARAKLL